MQVEAPTAYAGDRSLSPITHKKIDNNSKKLSSEFHTSEQMYTDTMEKNFTKFQSENYGLDKYFIDYRI